MSTYPVLRSASGALRRLLWEDFDADPPIRRIVSSEQAIVFRNPKETATRPADRLSLWLFRVTENEFVKNQPELRANGSTTSSPAPLAVDLHYLLTPFARSDELDHLLLGKAMQVLYDNATTLLRIPAEGVAEELRIVLARRTLEELTRIWEALQEPYRLSVAYEVAVTEIDSLRIATHERVIERIAAFDDDPVAVAEEE